jgi:hypothetical protein
VQRRKTSKGLHAHECSLSLSEDRQPRLVFLRVRGERHCASQGHSCPRSGHRSLRRQGPESVRYIPEKCRPELRSQPCLYLENGAVHVSGTEFGYFITKQEYKNYYLRAEFKWSEGTFPPRQGQARDSGILYNIQGPNKVGPRSIEFQINEGCTGDFWMTDGAALTLLPRRRGRRTRHLTRRQSVEGRPLQQRRIQKRHRLSRPDQ